MVTSLLRFPGSSIPTEALTGERVLDRYLVNLDARLLGGAKVRLLTLAEIKDHLQERKATALAQGVRTEEEAARAAVEAMGIPETVAKEQRSALVRRAVRTGLHMGVTYCLMLLLLGRLEKSLAGGVLGLLVQGLIFGLFMATIMTFVHPLRVLSEREEGDTFRVGYSDRVHRLSLVLSLLFAAICVMGVAAAVGIEPLNPWGWHRGTGIVMAILSGINVRSMSWASSRILVEGDGFWVVDWNGRERVSWASVTGLVPIRERSRWVWKNEHWSKVLLLEYTRAKGGVRRVKIFPDATNTDRFVRLVREQLRRASADRSA